MRITAIAAAAILLATASACKRENAATASARLEEKLSARTIRLYFEGADLRLVPEVRNVSLPENDAAALPRVVAELLKGSANAAVPRLFPQDATARASYLLPGGVVIVDLGGSTLTGGWNTGSHTEMMAAYSLVQTITANFPQVKQVRILINGQPAETLGGHLALGKPLRPIPWLLRQ